MVWCSMLVSSYPINFQSCPDSARSPYMRTSVPAPRMTTQLSFITKKNKLAHPDAEAFTAFKLYLLQI